MDNKSELMTTCNPHISVTCESGGELKRTLNSRIISMIALGGSIGTGLFLASGYGVHTAGPGGAVVAYGVIAFMVYWIMTGLTEMAAYMPVTGSFETYSTKYVDPALGFAIGWNYWFTWAVCLGSEVIAGGMLMKYWFPDSSVTLWSGLFLLILTCLNLFSARAFGEAEYVFAGIKVVTVIVFLIVGALMIFGIVGGHAIGLSNYVSPFPSGFTGILMIAFSAAFSLGGTELLGIAAGESENPEVTVPKANKSLMWRIVLFYIGAIFVVGAIIPWQEAGIDISPFTLVFEKSGIPYAADILNFVIITSVLSCGNSGTYAATRLLYALAKGNKAPAFLGKVSQNGVPVNALLFTVAIGAFSFLTGFYAESTVYMWLLALSGLTTLFTWLGISYTHLRFRKIYLAEHGNLSGLKYVSPWYPWGSIAALIICSIVTIGTFLDPESRLSVYLGVPAFLILLFGYKIKYKTKMVPIPQRKQY